MVDKKSGIINSLKNKEEVFSAEILRLNQLLADKKKKDEIIGAEIVRLNKALLLKEDKNVEISAEVLRLNQVLIKKRGEVATPKRIQESKSNEKVAQVSGNSGASSRETSDDDDFALLEDEGESASKKSSLSSECTRMVSSIQSEMKSFMELVSKIEGAHQQVKSEE